jgi:serine/threonine-protein kinase HipA
VNAATKLVNAATKLVNAATALASLVTAFVVWVAELGLLGDDPGYRRLAPSLRMPGRDEMLVFLRRLVFDILCGNGDSHVKNWSLIYRDRVHARLAPAYDIVPTVLFPRYPQTLALDFVGVTLFAEITRDRFRQLAKKLDMPPADLLAIVDETIERAQDAFGASAREGTLTAEECAQMEAHWRQVPLLRGR